MEKVRKSLFFIATFGFLTLCGSAWAVEDSNLISYWKFDEGSGTTVCDLVGNNDGALNGDPNWTTGQVGGALSFDGEDDYVSLGSPASLDNLPLGNFTVSAWIYDEHTAGTTWGTIAACYAHNRGWAFRTFSNTDGYRFLTLEVPHAITWVRYYSSDGTIVQNTWHHIAAVWDANTKTAKLYIDGFEPTYQTMIAGVGPYNSDASRNKEIGRIPHTGGGQYFNGIIDEVAIYDRALFAEEIQQIYERGLHGQGLDVNQIIAINSIKRAIDEKLAAVERIDTAVKREWAAVEALDELLASQEFEGLTKSEIIRVKLRVYQSIKRQLRTKVELQRSIEDLESALESLDLDYSS